MTDKTKEVEPTAEEMSDTQLAIAMLIEVLERLDTIEGFLRAFLEKEGFTITEEVPESDDLNGQEECLN